MIPHIDNMTWEYAKADWMLVNTKEQDAVMIVTHARGRQDRYIVQVSWTVKVRQDASTYQAIDEVADVVNGKHTISEAIARMSLMGVDAQVYLLRMMSSQSWDTFNGMIVSHSFPRLNG